MKRKNIFKLIKVNVLLTIILIINFIIGSVYAECTCNVDLEVLETKVKKNDQFVVNVNLSDIQSERGIIALSATIDYDKTSLFIEGIEGTKSWETPSIGSSYNKENGKIAITRNGFGKENETIIKITFRVTEESKKDLTVKLKDVALSDGEEIVKIDEIAKDIKVKDGKKNTNQSGKSTKKNTIIILMVIIAIIILIVYLNKKKKK